MVQPQGPGLAALDLDGRRLLHRGRRGGHGRFGKPEIFNTDQGSQFTSREFTALLIGAGIKISMAGKGAWRDNVFVERIWKSVKYEEVYLRVYASVSDARASISRYLAFYNGRRPHQSLGRQTPDQAYFNALQPIPVAA